MVPLFLFYFSSPPRFFVLLCGGSVWLSSVRPGTFAKVSFLYLFQSFVLLHRRTGLAYQWTLGGFNPPGFSSHHCTFTWWLSQAVPVGMRNFQDITKSRSVSLCPGSGTIHSTVASGNGSFSFLLLGPLSNQPLVSRAWQLNSYPSSWKSNWFSTQMLPKNWSLIENQVIVLLVKSLWPLGCLHAKCLPISGEVHDACSG